MGILRPSIEDVGGKSIALRFFCVPMTAQYYIYFYYFYVREQYFITFYHY